MTRFRDSRRGFPDILEGRSLWPNDFGPTLIEDTEHCSCGEVKSFVDVILCDECSNNCCEDCMCECGCGKTLCTGCTTLQGTCSECEESYIRSNDTVVLIIEDIEYPVNNDNGMAGLLIEYTEAFKKIEHLDIRGLGVLKCTGRRIVSRGHKKGLEYRIICERLIRV